MTYEVWVRQRLLCYIMLAFCFWKSNIPLEFIVASLATSCVSN